MATTEEILDAIGSMTVLELSELKKAFEERFDVTAAAPAAVMAAPVAGGDAGAAAKLVQLRLSRPDRRGRSLRRRGRLGRGFRGGGLFRLGLGRRRLDRRPARELSGRHGGNSSVRGPAGRE